MKDILIVLIVLVLAGGGVYYFLTMDDDIPEPAEVEENLDLEPETNETEDDTSTTTEEEMGVGPIEVIGTSADGHDITAYHYGDGDTELLFVGGIHGGYSWNTVLVASELMAYLEDAPGTIPDNVRVTVIPVLNPDGLNDVVGVTTPEFTQADVPEGEEATIPGRFNGNDVDLNRNFDCEWREEATWRQRSVSGGSAPFSEPETAALRDYVAENTPTAAVVWYAAAGGVYASNCNNGVPAETLALTNLYADASGYPAFEEFDFYAVTGDMVNWLAKSEIPAISVLLTNHEDVEWSKNKAGIDAMLEQYGEE